MIDDFCLDMHKWLTEHPQNVAAIHCKAGKGRTGVIIAAWLLFNNEWPDADQALAFYAAARTINQKGVTIPSQIRYVRYFGEALKRKGGYDPPAPRTLLLKEIILRDFVSPGELRWQVDTHGISGVAFLRSWKDAGAPIARQGLPLAHEPIRKGSTAALTPSKNVVTESQDLSLALHPPLPLCGDIRFECAGKPVQFHFWISTAMVTGTSVTLQKAEIDKANKDKKKIYPPGFNVTLVFTEHEAVVETAKVASRTLIDETRKKLEYRLPSLLTL